MPARPAATLSSSKGSVMKILHEVPARVRGHRSSPFVEVTGLWTTLCSTFDRIMSGALGFWSRMRREQMRACSQPKFQRPVLADAT